MEEQNINPQSEIRELKELVEKNIKLSEEVLELSKNINSFVFWQKIFGVLKILIIAVPIIIGLIYLPPLLKDAIDAYKNLLGFEDGLTLKNLPSTREALSDTLKSYLPE